MHVRIFITLFVLFFSAKVLAETQSHIVLKNDFNNDGVADRIIFASHGISGMLQSTAANKKVDTFYFKQGNRTIFFTSDKNLGGPYIKLTENAGFFSVISFLKYENKKFQHVSSFTVPGVTYFEEDPFADPFAETQDEKNECTTPDAFNNKAIKESLTWAEATQKHSIEETIKKAIHPECKTVFGEEYDKLEKQILSACSVSSGKPEKNDLVSCLDKNKSTRILSGKYKMSLAEKIFDDGFKITCGKSEGKSPQESFNSTSNTISLFQTNPAIKNRNFKANFFHGMMHGAEVVNEQTTETLVQMCLKNIQIAEKSYVLETSALNLGIREAKNKDGIEVSIPSRAKEIPQTSVAFAVNEGSKALDTNPSMENAPQFKALSSASKATFRSFEPLMAAAYNAAVPTAFAQNTIGNANLGVSATTTTILTTKASMATASSRSVASAGAVTGATYEVASLPDSVSASPKGELGNGMVVKASAISVKENSLRSPAAVPTSSSEVASSGSVGNGHTLTGSSQVGSLASLKTTERTDLRNNVPQLKTEEDFIRTLSTGKYAEVKAKLTDPANQKILEDRKIQYVAKDQTLGSKQPVIILKDLGNKFSILRVNVE